MELNVPGHEHASTGIISGQFGANPNANAVAEFEYRFDGNDNDTSGGPGGVWTGKNTTNNHTKAVQAVQWLNDNYATTSWFVPAHPERKSKYTVADFRDFNNAAPTVAFGFESQPGHQKSASRGEYNTGGPAAGDSTYGGTGVYSARDRAAGAAISF